MSKISAIHKKIVVAKRNNNLSKAKILAKLLFANLKGDLMTLKGDLMNSELEIDEFVDKNYDKIKSLGVDLVVAFLENGEFPKCQKQINTKCQKRINTNADTDPIEGENDPAGENDPMEANTDPMEDENDPMEDENDLTGENDPAGENDPTGENDPMEDDDFDLDSYIKAIKLEPTTVKRVASKSSYDYSDLFKI